MLSPAEAQERASALVQRAQMAGADAGDAIFIADASEGVSVRLGLLEDVERSESEHIGLRVFVGRRSASIGSTDLSDAALAELADRAVAMARAAPEDQYAGLAPEDRLLRGPGPDLQLAEAEEPSPRALRDLAEQAEEAARAVPGVTNSEGGSASASQAVVALATSHGFAGSYRGTSRSISAAVLAGEGAAMQRDYGWRQARYLADLITPQEIGRIAGQRAVARLNPGRMKSGPMPVVLDPRVGGSLLSHLAGAIGGFAVSRRASFLLDKLEAQLFDSAITIVDDPHRLRGARSKPFDGEGLPTARRDLVAGGKLTGWLLDSASARQLGLAPTGHAARGASGAPGPAPTNMHLAAGSVSPAALIADITDGVYITEFIGQGVNGLTGDYSRGASGFRIQGGEITTAVAEFTVAGNLIDMFAALTPADDLEWHRSVNVPTIRVDGMMVAGD